MKKYAKFCKEKLIQKLQNVFKLSVNVVLLTIHLILPLKSVKLYTIFMHFDSILANIFDGGRPQTPNGRPYSAPSYPLAVSHFEKYNLNPAFSSVGEKNLPELNMTYNNN